MRVKKQFTTVSTAVLKQKMLTWAHTFYKQVVWLDTNQVPAAYHSYDAILALDAHTSIQTGSTNAFNALEEYQNATQDWIFGYLSYDLKNDIEALASKGVDGLGFADLCFFQPKKLILCKDNTFTFLYLPLVKNQIDTDWQTIQDFSLEIAPCHTPVIEITPRISKRQYIDDVTTIQDHIQKGDIYETNFCQEFYAENAHINPLTTYMDLNKISNAPFASFIKMQDKYVLSASPERYLKKQGRKIITQPIKGTAKRDTDAHKDALLAADLKKDPKERSENIMIVDLVRNDLSITAEKASVKVEELCKIYSFSQVHQMISTVVSTIKEGTSAISVLKTTFPMGSMTGAPKIAAMQIMERLETTKRGVYSGAIGYFTPEADFDFSVVIRTILYNATTKYVSYSVGSAITAKSIADKEYQECLIKANAMRLVLEQKTSF